MYCQIEPFRKITFCVRYRISARWRIEDVVLMERKKA